LILADKSRRRYWSCSIENMGNLLICNKTVIFCNELPVYFADEVGTVGFTKCQYKGLFYINVDVGYYLVV
jgi:hypothetical protein